jgi:Tol biopolymer transport system component
VIKANPENNSYFDKPRRDIVLINPETGHLSIFLSVKTGNLFAKAWSPDSKSFAMFWSGGPYEDDIYVFDVNDEKRDYDHMDIPFDGEMSSDWKQYASIYFAYLWITDTQYRNVQKYKLPFSGSWEISDWSSDTNLLALIYGNGEQYGFENIYLFDKNSGDFTQFTFDDKYFKYSAKISPNGRLIAYIMWRFHNNEVEKKLLISRLDNSYQWTMPIDNIMDYAWSPDNERMFIICRDEVYVAELSTLFGSVFSYQ